MFFLSSEFVIFIWLVTFSTGAVHCTFYTVPGGEKKSLVMVIDNLPFLYRVHQSVQIKSFNFVFISESGGTFHAESVNFFLFVLQGNNA